MSTNDLTPAPGGDDGSHDEDFLASYEAPAPAPEFVAALGQRLAKEQAPAVTDAAPLDRSNRIIAGVLIALALCLLLMLGGVVVGAWYLLSSGSEQLTEGTIINQPPAEPVRAVVEAPEHEAISPPIEASPVAESPDQDTHLANREPPAEKVAPTAPGSANGAKQPGTPVAEGLTGRSPRDVATNAASKTERGDNNSTPRYGWKAGQSYAYNFSVEAKMADGKHTSTGRVTYQTVDPSGEFQASTPIEHATGTGFVVSADGHLVTCAHVVRGATKVDVKFGDRTYEAKVLSLDKRNDLALLKIDAKQLAVLSMGDSSAVELAQNIRVVGYPLTDVLGASIKVTSGTVCGFIDQDSDQLFQVDAPINAGNSGGPVVNESGQVVGVASAKLSGEEISNVGFAVPVAEVCAMLRKVGVRFNEAASTETLSGPELARRVTPSVALLEVTIGDGGVGLAPRVQLNYNASMTTKEPSTVRVDPRDPFGGRFGPRGIPRGPRGFGAFAAASPTKTERGKLHTDILGETYEDEFDLELPYLFGPVALLAIDPLGEEGEGSWYRQRTISLIRTKEEEQQDNSPFGPRLRRPAFFHDPFAPREEPRKKVVGVTSAFERYDYEVGAANDDTITIKKRYSLKTLDEHADPKIGMKGDGEIVFDRIQGVPKSSTFHGTLEVVSENVTLRIPVTFTYSATDPNPPKPAPAAVAIKPSTPPKLVDRTLQPEQVDDVLTRLASTEQRALRTVLSELGRATPGERRTEIAQAVEPLLQHDEWTVRQQAAAVLTTWGVPQNTTALIAALSDDNFVVRRDAIKALAKLPSKQAAEAIVSVYGKDAHDAKAALIAIGPAAEGAVLTLIKHKHWIYRGDACEILGKIGSEASLADLRSAQKETNGLVKHRARDAVAAIEARDGKHPSPELEPANPLDKKYRGPGSVSSTGRMVTDETELFVGQILLVKDSSAWYASEVLEVLEDGRVKINFRGWGHSWDKVVARSVLQLAPAEVTQPNRPAPATAVVTPQANRKQTTPKTDPTADDLKEAETVLRAFVLALTLVDRDAAKPLMVATTDDDILWKAARPPEFSVASIEKAVEDIQFQSLQVGDAITLPGGREAKLTSRHVGDGKLMLTWAGNPIPFMIVKTEDGWHIDARSIVAARKAVARSSTD